MILVVSVHCNTSSILVFLGLLFLSFIIIIIIMFICQMNITTEAMYRPQWARHIRQRSTYDCLGKQTNVICFVYLTLISHISDRYQCFGDEERRCTSNNIVKNVDIVDDPAPDEAQRKRSWVSQFILLSV